MAKEIVVVGKFKRPARWVEGKGGSLPYKPVEAGEDDGEKIYVGRALHEGDLIPGKIVPSHGVCYIAYGGQEVAKSEYHAMANPNQCELVWVPACAGEVPSGALQGGKTADGEALFIGKATHEGSTVIGKIHPSHQCLYFPFAGQELGTPEYESLCLKCVPFAEGDSDVEEGHEDEPTCRGDCPPEEDNEIPAE